MPEQSSDPWRIVWQFLTNDGVLVFLLLATASSLVVASWIPQQPASDADYARWLSRVQARFGVAVSAMRLLGLFNVTRSLGFRVLLALMSGCLLLRLVETVERLLHSQQTTDPSGEWVEVTGRQLSSVLNNLRRRHYRVSQGSSVLQIDRWPWAHLFPPVVHSGALLLLAGLLLMRLWGWQVEGLVLQDGQRTSLPGSNNWVVLAENGETTVHSSGVVAFLERRGPGVKVRAVDNGGQFLQLQSQPEAEPSSEVTIALAEERYFAIPEADLVGRLTPRSAEAFARVDVQVYRSPPGEMIIETVTEKGGDSSLTVEGVTVEVTSAPYALVTAIYNPGRWPASFGLLLLVIGVTGNLIWPVHRFWLREDDASIATAGPAPSWVLEEGA